MDPPPPAPRLLPPSHSSSLIHLFPTYSHSHPHPHPHPHPDDVIELPASSFPFSSSRLSAINRNHLNNRSKRKRASTSLQPTTHVIQIDDDYDDDDNDDDDDVVLISETLPSHKHKHKSNPNPNPNPKPRLAFPTPSPISQLSSSYNYYASSSSSSSSSLPLPLPTGSNPNPNPKPPSLALDHFNFQDDDSDFDYDYDSDYDPLLLHDHTAFDFPIDPTFTLQPVFDGLDIPTGIEAPLPWFHKSFPTKESATSSASASPSSLQHPKVLNHDDLDAHYNAFKQFDTVTDHTDHHFIHPKFNSSSHKPTKEWTKRIQNDWKLLEKDLPDSIFIRVYEDRMDLLRAVIIGPAGTPYHDGLYFFDVHFPPTYPHMPPMVHYNSGGLRLNPNLYACGKVCLSLLNTWSGSGCERWNPANSTMLQVLVSIQALVLNSKPYFNEPGYSVQANTPHGEQKSLAYNESTFLLSCKTMLYSLRRPPKHFEHFVAGHFRKRGYAILVACRAYMEGAQVGCLVGDGVQDVDEGDKSSSSSFKTSLKRIFEDLLMEFTVKGADCDEFLVQKRNQGTAAIPASQPSSVTVTELSLDGPLFHL